MKKVIEALQTKGMAGLESPTGTGKTLCLLCACLGYLKHLREELIQNKNNKSENGQDKKEEMNQPVIYYTSRTHAQITNVIKELRKTVYRPINAVISSR
jgi:regulator of telomere elongation helicase 1